MDKTTTTGEIRFISPSTPSDWAKYYQLRWTLLREPWQQPKGSEKDEYEDLAYHVMAIVDGGDAIGVGRVHVSDDKTAQIRYMAVIANRRRQHIGTDIITLLETKACEWGAKTICLNARNEAVGFYHNMGYLKIGAGETLFNCIEHTRMKKQL